VAIDFRVKPYWVMGVVNITPDSFSDGGQFLQTEAAIQHALKLVSDGADMLDLGAESTRPGASPVSTQEELSRLVPVLRALRQATDIPISIDSSNPEVMRACLSLGADMLNDVRSFQAAESLTVLNEFCHVPICLMHMQGDPLSMQHSPYYEDVVADVIAFLTQQVSRVQQQGFQGTIVLDPGFGFGKTLAHNIALFKALPRMVSLGYPVLVGVSRKKMIGELTGRADPKERKAGSIAAAIEAVRLGAKIIRVHDVAETVDALTVSRQLRVAQD
jgi:dihydropteroate synthase